MNPSETAPIARFCSLSPQQLDALRVQLGLGMSTRTLAHCAAYYRSRERRAAPTAEVLRLLDALAALPARPGDAALSELYTNDVFAAGTYADMMNKRRELFPAASSPVTLREALTLATAYLARGGKPQTPGQADLRLRWERDGLVSEAGLGGPGSAPGDGSPVGAEGSGFSLLPRATALPGVAEGDQFLLLHRRDMPAGQYRALTGRLLRRPDTAGMIRRIAAVPEGGLLPLLLRLCRGFCCDLRRLQLPGDEAPLSLLADRRFAGDLLLAVPAQHTGTLVNLAAQAGLRPVFFAYAAPGNRAALINSAGQTVSLETAFLGSLTPRPTVVAHLPDEKEAQPDPVSHTPVSAALCPYLHRAAQAPGRVTADGCLLAVAHVQTGGAFFRSAVRAALLPLLSLSAAGQDYARQRLAVGLALPKGPLTPGAAGEGMATVLGLYRVQTELGLPAAVLSVQTDPQLAHPALTVFSCAPLARPQAAFPTGGRPALPSSFVSAGSRVYCVSPTVGPDGLPDFALLRRLLTELCGLGARGALRSARAVCGERLPEALERMAGGGLSFRLSGAGTGFEGALPPGVLLEASEPLPYTEVAEVTAAAPAAGAAAQPLPELPAQSLIWSDCPEAVLVCARRDAGAQALAGVLRQHGIACGVFEADPPAAAQEEPCARAGAPAGMAPAAGEEPDAAKAAAPGNPGGAAVCRVPEELAGPLSRAALTARFLILCGAVALPQDGRMRFALSARQEAGGVLLALGEGTELPAGAQVIRFPEGLPAEFLTRMADG